MTFEEALKIKQNWTPEQARNDLERLIITGEKPADKVVGLACQALDKQIPKRPKIKKMFTRIYGFELRCPHCEAVLQSDTPHCKYCGQALDWSDSE